MNKALKILVVAMMLAITGCEAAFIIGPAINVYIMWKEGEAHSYYATDATTLHNALLRTLKTFNYGVNSDTANDKGWYVNAGDKDRFKINIVQVEPYVTRLDIRINFMGDKDYAELIYKNLNKELDVIEFKKAEKRHLIRR